MLRLVAARATRLRRTDREAIDRAVSSHLVPLANRARETRFPITQLALTGLDTAGNVRQVLGRGTLRMLSLFAATSRRIRIAALVLLSLGATAVASQAASVPTQNGILTPLWRAPYDGPTHKRDEGEQMVVSPDGTSIFVSGISATPETSGDYTLVAYDAATGAQRWVGRYSSPGQGEDTPRAIGISPDGTTVFVTGEDSTYAYATVAFDAARGTQEWVALYGPHASPTALAVSHDGAMVFVTGWTQGLDQTLDYATVGYEAATGQQRWAARYTGPVSGDDRAQDVGVSPDGSLVFVTGDAESSNSADYATVAYDQATGSQRWVSLYDGPVHVVDVGSALAVSADGATVFATGSSDGYIGVGGYDYATVAYEAASGNERWVSRYAGKARDDDEALAIAPSPDGSRVFVTGESTGPDGASDYVTVAVDAATGVKRWVARSQSGRFLRPSTIAVTPDGTTVCVTGADIDFPNAEVTIAYDATMGDQWGFDRIARGYGRDLAISPDGSVVFVTGSIGGDGVEGDFGTIAYTLAP
jgi:hypothetical protein